MFGLMQAFLPADLLEEEEGGWINQCIDIVLHCIVMRLSYI